MNNTFNPDRAIMEEEEGGSMDEMLTLLEHKVRVARASSRAATDELLRAARAERGELVKAAAGDFADLVGTAVDAAVENIVEQGREAQEATQAATKAGYSELQTKASEMLAGVERLEKLTKAVKARGELPPDERPQQAIETVRMAVTALQAQLAAHVARCAEHEAKMMQAMTPPTTAATMPKATSYSFQIERDDRARIKNVIATPLA